jgi:hypothetical protein
VQSALISGTRPPQKLRKPTGVAVLVKIDRTAKSCPIPFSLMVIPLWNNWSQRAAEVRPVASSPLHKSEHPSVTALSFKKGGHEKS